LGILGVRADNWAALGNFPQSSHEKLGVGEFMLLIGRLLVSLKLD